jgi:hypothetical protein
VPFGKLWRNVDDFEVATLNSARWFNEVRLHSAIGYAPPAESEQNH